jgi:acyl-CoA thioester hydrolase
MGIIMPVASLEIKYLRPAFYDSLLQIVTTLKEMPTDRANFHTEIFNEAGKLVNAGVTTLVFVDTKTKTKTSIPKELYEKLIPFFKQ